MAQSFWRLEQRGAFILGRGVFASTTEGPGPPTPPENRRAQAAAPTAEGCVRAWPLSHQQPADLGPAETPVVPCHGGGHGKAKGQRGWGAREQGTCGAHV